MVEVVLSGGVGVKVVFFLCFKNRSRCFKKKTDK